jgi:serine/threonine-protein kinase
MLYEALSGSRPVDGENAGQVLKRLLQQGIAPLDVVAPDVPKDVAELVGKMLSRDRDARPADLREVHAALERHGSASVQRFGAAVGEHEGSALPGGVESAAVVAPEPLERRGFRRGPLFVGIVASAALLSGFLAAQRTEAPRREPTATVVKPPVTVPPAAAVDVAPAPRLATAPAGEAAVSEKARFGASKRPVERIRRSRPKAEPVNATNTVSVTSRGLVDEPPF